MPSLGTRSKTNISHSHPSSRAPTSSFTRDVGMTKLVVASVTFTTSSAQATAAAGTFVHFAVGDPIMVEGSPADDGFYQMLATDASTYLTLDPPPKNGGPVSVTIRTP